LDLSVSVCFGFRASDLGFSLWGRLGLPARRVYPPGRSPYGAEASPEGAKIFVEVVLFNIQSVRISRQQQATPGFLPTQTIVRAGPSEGPYAPLARTVKVASSFIYPAMRDLALHPRGESHLRR